MPKKVDSEPSGQGKKRLTVKFTFVATPVGETNHKLGEVYHLLLGTKLGGKQKKGSKPKK